MVKLRPYQLSILHNIQDSWEEGCKNVLATLPTGAGKTVIFSEIIREHSGPSCTIAHRQELVSQISLALARNGVNHRIIGPKAVVKNCVAIQMKELERH